MPAKATEPCELFRLLNFAAADLEIGYNTRGAEVKDCDENRQLAIDTYMQQQKMLDDWAAARAERERPWWKKIGN